MITRQTTPVVLSLHTNTSGKLDYMERLEWSDDEYGRFEGKVTAHLETAAAQAIADRGDSTFLLEYSSDGAIWYTLYGGFAKDWDIEVDIDQTGLFYTASFAILDMWTRAEEFPLMTLLFADALTVGDAFNKFVQIMGFAPSTIPADVAAKKLPPVRGSNPWRFQPREGDTLRAMIETLLLFMRSQGTEWRVLHDWSAQEWVWEQKPYDPTNYWQAMPYTSGDKRNTLGLAEDEGDRIIALNALRFRPHPPEGNLVQTRGLTSPDPNGNRITSGMLYNFASLYGPVGQDYLGRVVPFIYDAWPITDEGEIKKMNLRVFDAVNHRRLDGQCSAYKFYMSLEPNTALRLLKGDGTAWSPDVFVKRRYVTIERDDLEEVSYDFDSIWAGALR
jgi:hypothetical protein